MAHQDALKGMHDGKRSGKREQQVFTPPEIFQRLIQEWGSIQVDSSADPFRWIPAQYHLVGKEGYDGLALPWLDCTYCNPEYAKLKPWLCKACLEAKEGKRIALLCPARSHRKWYRQAHRTLTGIVELDPIAFYAQHPETGNIEPHVSWDKKYGKWRSCKFPVPLVLMAWNWNPTPQVWQELGDTKCLQS